MPKLSSVRKNRRSFLRRISSTTSSMGRYLIFRPLTGMAVQKEQLRGHPRVISSIGVQYRRFSSTISMTRSVIGATPFRGAHSVSS